MSQNTVKELFSFIEQSPTCFHAVDTMEKALKKEGYEQLYEGEKWQLMSGGKYYVIRGGASLIAFRMPSKEAVGFQIMSSHSDSPMFKIKQNPEIDVEGHYVKLNVEKYGGLINGAWFDRPLSIAGRLVVKTETGVKSVLLDAKRDLCMIPNLAIHLDHDRNKGYTYENQKDMLPIYAEKGKTGDFLKDMAGYAKVSDSDVLDYDLFVYNNMAGSIWGANEEFLSAPRLDDLECAFASLQAFLRAAEGESIPMHCVFDNEEVGSRSMRGAASTFMVNVIQRICQSLSSDATLCQRMLANSFMISADNAHALHPNYVQKYCPTNHVFMNEGIVIKYSANQKYTTDGISASVFKRLCEITDVPCQMFVNHADVAGGSTLGNISQSQVSLPTVDIGLAQLAMHSPYETAGIRDIDYLIRVAKHFYEHSIIAAEGEYLIK